MTITLDLNHLPGDSHTRRTLSEISLSLAKSKKIVVVTGAGISCSCGIPDFRSSDGLYALVKERFPDVVLKGRDLFDAALFRDATSTAVFYTFISGLKRSIDLAKPTPTHHFIKTLDSKKKLLRSYTQNIDGLEARVGLLGTSCQEAKSTGKGKNKLRTKDIRNVQLHGDIHRVRCMACSAEYPCTEEHLVSFEKGTAPDCPECLSRSEARVARSARAIRVGSLRPAIVLYDESHPLGDDIGSIHSADLTRKPDMLIIMGTSLKVHGLKKLVKDFARTIHSSSSSSSSSKKPCKVVFVNKTAPGSEWSDVIDYHIVGETDQWTTKVVEDWKKMRPVDWEVQQTLVHGSGDSPVAKGLKVVKSLVVPLVKDKKAGEGIENIAPIPPTSATTGAKSSPPLSPSKRQRKASHYDDVEVSPSKRQSTSDRHHAMPSEERKLLFKETTNKQPSSTIDKLEVSVSRLDISICDASMREADISYTALCRAKLPVGSSKDTFSKAETSQMDISIRDLSMRDAEAFLADLPPAQPSRKLPSNIHARQTRAAPRRAAKPKGRVSSAKKKPCVELVAR
ncbi:DHS-like NAD/FAD-binding domain-containing protein [Crassisporium funariophilum]|nr:DHS-like NAD/FAD-binding domain-containing protein [Crassisporium funariophilum]